MTTITIPKKLTKGEELIIIPRKEYEEFSSWREKTGYFREFTPTVSEKSALRRARENYKKGNYITLHEFKRKMATLRRR